MKFSSILSMLFANAVVLAGVSFLFIGEGISAPLTANPDTVTVATDGTGNFTSVQQAVDAAPEGGTRLFIVRIKPGRYREKILISKSKGPIQLRGTDAVTTVLTFDDNAETVGADGKPIGTTRSASVEISADRFSAENLTFENPFGAGRQAVALDVSSARATFRHCRFLGWQDTLLVNRGAQYFEDCYIAGSVDFIFGAAAVFFERCELHCRARGAITAASTPDTQAHGFVFSHCRITTESGDWKTTLGRPWRPFASVAFLWTEMPAAIVPEGWSDWNGDTEREKTVRYTEHGSTGPGGGTTGRVPWSRQLTEQEASELLPMRVLGWDPLGGLLPERIAALPAPEADAWWRYLERSTDRREHDKAVLADELKKANLEQPVRPPPAADFKLDEHLAPSWYASDAARTLAVNIISFQTPSGGWSKHISFDQGPRPPGTTWTSDASPWHYVGTFDNHSTTEEMVLLARVYQATHSEPCRAAFLHGLDYIFDAQFPNGGWPQVYPIEGGYHDGITFNDDAMTHVLELLRDVAAGTADFAFVDAPRRVRAQAALDRGVANILRCQYVQNGRLTVWCAQHDPITLAPAWARLKEPPSLSGGESVEIVRFLMSLRNPSREIVTAIESALAWFERSKFAGVRIVNNGGKRSYVADPASTQTCWARFYDLNTNQPLFAGGQDGVVYHSFDEMAAKGNRTSYDYILTRPEALLLKDQPKWRAFH